MSKVMKYSYKNELIDEKLKSISSWIKSKHTEMTGNVYLYITIIIYILSCSFCNSSNIVSYKL